MMKRLIYIFSFVMATAAIAQNTNSIALEKQKIKQALSYGDKVVAANAMYSIVAMEGPQSTYKDSLAYLYFNARNYVSCFLVTNDILASKNDNLELLEMKAFSLENMGALDKAIESYNELLLKKNNNYHAYKIAGLQLALNKFDEALVFAKKADQLPDEGKTNVTFQVNKNYSQNVNLKAAIAYLEGLVYLNLKKENEAKKSFERAVQLFPEFVLAKSKLTTLNANKQ
jgi:tetratricopeptide (TPR) repeat protein